MQNPRKLGTFGGFYYFYEKVDIFLEKSLEKVDGSIKKSLEKIDSFMKKSLEKVAFLGYTINQTG